MTKKTKVPKAIKQLFHDCGDEETRRVMCTMTKIDSGLYLSGKTSAHDRNLLDRYGIKHILNAAHGEVASAFKGAGVTYFDLNLEDRKKEDIGGTFTEACAWLRERRKRNEPVLIHCYAGISRSVTLTTAHLMDYKGLSLYKALAHVVECRPIACPNNGFLRQLVELEAELA